MDSKCTDKHFFGVCPNRFLTFFLDFSCFARFTAVSLPDMPFSSLNSGRIWSCSWILISEFLPGFLLVSPDYQGLSDCLLDQNVYQIVFQVVYQIDYQIVDQNVYQLVDQNVYQDVDQNVYQIVDQNVYQVVDQNVYQSDDQNVYQNVYQIVQLIKAKRNLKVACSSTATSARRGCGSRKGSDVRERPTNLRHQPRRDDVVVLNQANKRILAFGIRPKISKRCEVGVHIVIATKI
jgi:hypothetical protein